MRNVLVDRAPLLNIRKPPNHSSNIFTTKHLPLTLDVSSEVPDRLTGDATRIDEDGFYYIVDRWKDMYISGGENVYPAEVESVLHQLSAVAEAAIIGVPNEQWGEVGMAIVAVKPGQALSPADIHAHCAANLAKFKCPRLVEFVDALPRNATGKIHKPTLRKQFSVSKPTDASAAAS